MPNSAAKAEAATEAKAVRAVVNFMAKLQKILKFTNEFRMKGRSFSDKKGIPTAKRLISTFLNKFQIS